MALNKVTYTDDVTVIGAQNLNAIQDEIISLETVSLVAVNSDLDTIQTPGRYRLWGEYTNAPKTGNLYGVLTVDGVPGALIQTYQSATSTDSYFRGYTNSQWYPWKQFMLNSGGTINGVVTIDEHNGTTSSVGASHLTLGNSIASGTAGNSTASLTMYGRQSYYTALYTAETLTSNRSIYFPDAGGTIALEAQTGASGNSQYTKFPDGTLMQWGIAGQYASGNRADVAITMPLAFVNSSYSVFANGEVGDDFNNYEVLIVIQRNTSQKFTAHIRNATGNYIRQFNWFAIGRWK